MGRKKTGTVYEKDGVLWYAFTLRSKKRYARRVPPLPGGGVANEAQARTYLAEAIRRYELGIWDPEAAASSAPVATATSYTVADYAERWVANLVHDSKFNERMMVRRYVAPSDLGRMDIRAVTPPHIAAWVRGLRAAASPRGGTLAPHTIISYWGFLKRMFLAAVFEQIITLSPCTVPAGTLPAGTDKVPGARRKWRYTREEVEVFISDVRVPPARRMLYAILFLAGVRAGEAAELRWRDWDPKRTPLGCLTVERSWASKRRLIKGTKTGVSREVPVHPTLAAMLSEWKLSGWAKDRGTTKGPNPDDLIVPNVEGNHRAVLGMLRSLHVDTKHLELTQRRLHGMRHTFISLAIDDGARVDVISKVTHAKAVRTAFDSYREEAWETLCAEVAKLRVTRRDDVLPLWKVIAGGGGSATNSATEGDAMRQSHVPEGVSENTTSPWGSSRRATRGAQQEVKVLVVDHRVRGDRREHLAGERVEPREHQAHRGGGEGPRDEPAVPRHVQHREGRGGEQHGGAQAPPRAQRRQHRAAKEQLLAERRAEAQRGHGPAVARVAHQGFPECVVQLSARAGAAREDPRRPQTRDAGERAQGETERERDGVRGAQRRAVVPGAGVLRVAPRPGDHRERCVDGQRHVDSKR